MATAYHTEDRQDRARMSLGSLLIAPVATKYQQFLAYRQTVKTLSALCDSDLSELGLSRPMIRSVARETALAT
ncbi:uncharacterized protein DUF1127 [Aliiruegeria haliotis]|uniref:Uncharacterized protein DUF1127 n=1 Tax=Aliiruegeria haliotis TaxID=1280846 RepID=A0A2T0RXU6_9RHOB|nr:DUF1127 domain-containing protein [Aliiruegeria haliotis]PRY25988.1 uncharacterized protein DUF1127 [Aliiruegeria haliotis]